MSSADNVRVEKKWTPRASKGICSKRELQMSSTGKVECYVLFIRKGL